MKIYLRTRKKFENIEQLLQYGYTRCGRQFKITYRNPECTLQECHSARRSFGDLLIICRTYFPKTTEKQLAKTIQTLNEKVGLRASYCQTIDKLVFLKDRKGASLDGGVSSYYNLRRGQGTHSYNDFIKLLK